MIVPGLAVAVGIQVFFIRLGLSDSVAGVVLVQLMPTVPYAATVFGAAFANLDVDYERQARTLGAGPVRTLLFVTVPLLLFAAIGSSDTTAAAALALLVVAPPLLLLLAAAPLLRGQSAAMVGVGRL